MQAENSTQELLHELLQDELLKDVAKILLPKKKDHSRGSDHMPKYDVDTVADLLTETECLIQTELGGACKIRLDRCDHELIDIVVKLDATVKELKRIVQIRVERAARRKVLDERKRIQAENPLSKSRRILSKAGNVEAPISDQEEGQLTGQEEQAVMGTKQPLILPRFSNINWKYIWSTNCLMLDGHCRLDNDRLTMCEVGLRNGISLTFTPYHRPKVRSLTKSEHAPRIKKGGR